MKVKGLIPLALVFLLPLNFYGTALGEGGGGNPTTPPQCMKQVPDPTNPKVLSKINALKGPILNGVFIASLDRTGVYYDVHFLLQGETSAPRFYIPTKVTFPFEQQVGPIPPNSRSICAFTPAELLRLYRWIPCSSNVQQPFGLQGVPVPYDLSICKCEFPEDRLKATIYGTVKIKVVPPGSF
jgi:hypothetical protein